MKEEELFNELRLQYYNFIKCFNREPSIILLSYSAFFKIAAHLHSQFIIQRNKDSNPNEFIFRDIKVTWAGNLQGDEIKIY